MAFPLDPLPLTTELFIGGDVGWVDITGDVRVESAHSGGGVSIRRGRSAEGSRADPGRLNLTLDNRSGRYSPRNPRGEWFGLFGRNTPIRVGVDLAADSFARTVGAGWGSTEDGRPWASSGGTAADFTVDGSQAKHLHPTKNAIRATHLNHDWQDVEQVTRVSIPAVAAVAPVVVGHLARHSSGTDSHYWLRLVFTPDGQVWIQILKRVAGVYTILLTKTGVGTYTAGQSYWLRSGVSGGRLSVKVWPAGSVEPVDWTASTNDRSITSAGRAGLASRVETGNTNTAEVRFDDYKATNRRFFGEVTTWPVKWDVGGFDRWVSIEASGILRRLNQGQAPLQSAMYRTYRRTGPVAWWPLETGDGRQTEHFASGVAGVPPLVASPATLGTHRATGAVSGSVAGPTGAGQAADLSGGGQLSAPVGQIRQGSPTTPWRFEMSILYTDPVEEFGVGQAVRIDFGSGSLVSLFAQNTPGSETTLELGGGSGFASRGADFILDDGNWHHIRLDLSSAGATATQYELVVDDVVLLNGVANGVPFGQPQRVTISPSGDVDAAAHVALWQFPNIPLLSDTWLAFNAHVGEAATERMARLAAEEGLPLAIVQNPSRSGPAMGPQGIETLMDLIGECAEVDGGILCERREDLGLVYRSLGSLYNQTPLALDYGHIAPPFEPVEDDHATINDVTATRGNGVPQRVVRETGPLSVEAVGRYDTSISPNVADDWHARNQAGWRLHLGTVDEARYPTISANFAARSLRDAPELAAKMQALDSGDVLSVDDLPDWLPPGPVKVMVQGYTETLDSFAWDITWNGTPGSAWDVGVVGQTRVASNEGATRLAAPIGAGDTSMLLATTQDNGPWTTNPADFPQDLRIGGELVTVSAIGPAVSDPFARTVSGGWGSEPGGLAYVNSGGTSANYSTNGTRGQISLEAISAARGVNLPIGVSDVELFVGACGVAAAPTGGNVEVGFRLRQSTPTRFIDLRLFRRPSTNDVTFALRQYVDGAEVVSAFSVVPGATAGSSISVRLWAQGTMLFGKAWVTGQKERAGWDLALGVTHVEPGDLNIRASLAAGVTNSLPYLTFYDDLLISRPQKAAISARAVNGVARGWPAGTEVQIADRRVVAL